MARTKISEYSTTAGNNTDINSINLAEGCAPSGINDAIRELMRQLKEFQTGGAGDSVNSGGDFSVATNKFTVASASGNTSVAGTLGVTGAATLSSTLAVTGTTTLTGALVANGNATLGDASGDTVTIKGTPTLEVNPTLSGGTANGVLYLNGSKVATSGSALTFDGTGLSVTGTSTATLKLNGRASDNGSSANFYDNTGATRYGFIYFDASTAQIASTNTTPLAFLLNGSEQMRLTSTGLGIGTSSPATKLHIYTASATGTYLRSENTAGFLYTGVKSTGVGYVATESNTALELGTNGTVRATLDSSGNLGLGVTPSAWNTFKVMQIGNFGAVAAVDSTSMNMLANTYYDGSFKRITTGAAGRYRIDDSHTWYIAASDTAGAAITFTQAMTLDASGNLGVGTTSPGSYQLGGKFVVAGSTSGFYFNDANNRIVLDGAGTTRALSLYFRYSSSATITSDSNLIFETGNGTPTERARITSSGDLLVGTTSNSRSSRLRVDGDETAYFTGYGSGYGIGLWMTPNASSSGGNATAISLQNVSNTTVGTITTTASATAYNTSSDYRLKENIQDVTGSGAFIDALQPRTWNWKVDGSAGAGFIAHELQAVSPSSVTGTKDAVDADGNPDYQAVEYGSAEVIAMLVAEVKSLRKRLADAGIA